MPVVVPPEYAITVLQEWLEMPETQSRLTAAIIRGMDAAEESVVWRIPRSPELRRNGLAAWLKNCREQIMESIAIEVNREFPFLSRKRAGEAAELAMAQLLPDVRERLERLLQQWKVYAIRGIALPWVTDIGGDLCRLGMPSWDEGRGVWIIPILIPSQLLPIAQVELNADGDVLTQAATLRGFVQAIA